MKLYFLAILSLTLISCENDKEQPQIQIEGDQINKQEITKKDVESLKYMDYGLGSDASQAVANWLQYKEVSENIENIKNADFTFFETDPETMLTLFTDLRANIPYAVNTSPIKARMLALETKLLSANSLFKLRNVSKDERLASIKEVLLSYSNFNDQMNRKFEMEINNTIRPTQN